MQSKTGGLRFNEGKLQWGLVDFEALENMVRVLMYGEKKYDAHNWKKGLPYVSVIESLLRHIYAFLRGEDVDPESGLPHTGHIMCNAMFLDYYSQYCKDMDNRFIDKKKGGVCIEDGCTHKTGDVNTYCGYHQPLITNDEKKKKSKTEQKGS